MRDYNRDYIAFLEKSLSRESIYLNFLKRDSIEDALKKRLYLKVKDLERRLEKAKLLQEYNTVSETKDYIFFLECSLSRENNFLHFLKRHTPEDVLKISKQQFTVADLEHRLAQAKLLEVQ